MRGVRLVLASLAFVPFAWAQSPVQSGRFSADDLPKIVRISDPQISPDGKTIAFVVGRANLKDDRWDTELDFIDVASKAMRAITHDRQGVGWLRWSPDGTRLAFLAQDSDKKAQVFVLPLAGGEALQLTHAKTPIRQLTWQPDGKALAFAAADEIPEKKDEAKFEDAFEVGNNSYLERAAAMPVHIWTIPAAGGTAKRLTSGTWSLPVTAAPGRSSARDQLHAGRQVHRLRSRRIAHHRRGRVQSPRTARRRHRSHASAHQGHHLAEGAPRLSPDGTEVAYGFPRDGKRRNEESVYVVSTEGASGAGLGKDVTHALDHALSTPGWMPDGKTLLVAGPDGTKTGMWLQPLDGAAKRLNLGTLVPGAANIGKDGSVAFTATDATHPPELFYMAHAGDAPTQMTHLQTVTEGKTLGKQETLTWKSDKFTVDGVLTYPPGYASGQKYPLVLYIHGGPTATSLETFTTSSQILAAQGWLVFEPNYRGSDNEGNAFEASIVNDASAGPGRDIMAGVTALEARGIVDEKRIAVSGWSYGGQMTAWMIGNYPTVWKAAVAGAPVTDLVDQYSLSDNNVERAAGYGPSPFVGDNLKSYALQSPLSYAYRIKTPTLIMSDVGDWRVTTTQAYKLFHALKDNGVPVKFIAFPVPGHSPADPIRSRDVWRRWTAWLDTYLNPAGSTVATGSASETSQAK